MNRSQGCIASGWARGRSGTTVTSGQYDDAGPGTFVATVAWGQRVETKNPPRIIPERILIGAPKGVWIHDIGHT